MNIGISEILVIIGKIFGILIPILVGLALIYFIWGLANYILDSGNEAKKEEGRSRMIWGSIALFVIVSVWGLVVFIQNTFHINGNVEISSPQSWK